MKLRNLKISTQLYLGLGVLVVCVVVLGLLAWQQSGALWQQTETMYEHPLPVSRAIRDLELDIVSIQRDLNAIVLADDQQRVTQLVLHIDIAQADAAQQLDVLGERYLGSAEDIAGLREQFIQWDAGLNEAIRLLQQGQDEEVLASIEVGGALDQSVRLLEQYAELVREFAMNKAAQLYADAASARNALDLRLAVVAGVIVALWILISLSLLRTIRRPLLQMARAAERFRAGDMKARSDYVSANELGVLASSFDSMADAIESEMQLHEKAAHISAVIVAENEARGFCRRLLKTLMEHTSSQVAAIYVLNDARSAFEHFESIGLDEGRRGGFSNDDPEGEFGLALASKEMQRISDIPEDTRFMFAAVGGDFRPREIATIPIVATGETIAVISLASIGGFDDAGMRLLRDSLPGISARLDGVLLFRRTVHLAERLDLQNAELATQKDELAAQTNELLDVNYQLEEQKRQLETADRLKSTFLSNMSHELRTPLNSVIALSGVLSRRLADKIGKEENDYLEIIERNGRHLLSLINDILDISRIASGREALELSTFSVRELASEIVAMLAPLAHDKDLTLANEVLKDLPAIRSDRDKLRHVLLNLIGNAIKFTDAGSVSISAVIADEMLDITVRDSGIGISAKDLPHVFEEFYQGDVSPSRRHGGTGLGLAIAKKYAEVLQGAIAVESVPGQGSTFTLSLPIDAFAYDDDQGEYEPTPSPTQTNDDAGVMPGRGQKILLVEDSDAVVIQMTEILSEEDYEIRTAKNGVEALARIEESVPDAVILDLMMPEMDGFEALEAIRAKEETSTLPVLILTARQVTREEFGVLKQNHVHQLIRKGDVGRKELLAAVASLTALHARPQTVTSHTGARGPKTDLPVVLVVEDNPDNILTMRALLAERCTMIEATEGREGLQKALRLKPDLIFMDLALPDCDGFEVLAGIRDDETLRDVPVVAVTASAMKGDREQILALGFDAYLSKPIDKSLLDETLSDMLRGGGGKR